MESLVHVEDIEDQGSVEWRVTAVILPGAAIERPKSYPGSWRVYPYGQSTQRFGSAWAHSHRSVALRVPSAVILGEFNYLLNPEHPDFAKLRISAAEPFRFDSRLAH
jgi:RES domain-containing protein